MSDISNRCATAKTKVASRRFPVGSVRKYTSVSILLACFSETTMAKASLMNINKVLASELSREFFSLITIHKMSLQRSMIGSFISYSTTPTFQRQPIIKSVEGTGQT